MDRYSRSLEIDMELEEGGVEDRWDSSGSELLFQMRRVTCGHVIALAHSTIGVFTVQMKFSQCIRSLCIKPHNAWPQVGTDLVPSVLYKILYRIMHNRFWVMHYHIYHIW